MKKIINGNLYDTETSQLLYIDEVLSRKLYKTDYGNFFVVYQNGEITEKTEESTKEYLGRVDPNLYIELWGNPEPEKNFDRYMNDLIESLDNQCEQTIFAGIDIELSIGTEHFTCNYQDQINLTALSTKLVSRTGEIEWHPADESVPCKYYSVEDMAKIMESLMAFKSYHITYFRDLRRYVRSFTKISDLENVWYGMAIPEEYKSEVLKNYESMMAQ